METDFSNYLVKSYQYWEVYMHKNQSYLGRCYVWCRRADALDMTDASGEEQKELFQILRELQKALKDCFNPDWLNYAFLGNETRHLHGHVIPRYKEPKVFMNTTFEDKLYGHNYRTDPEFLTTGELLQEVKSRLKMALG
jgi:diadenosine tetraphosphate (Ap4A) HIT family hydrolase